VPEEDILEQTANNRFVFDDQDFFQGHGELDAEKGEGSTALNFTSAGPPPPRDSNSRAKFTQEFPFWVEEVTRRPRSHSSFRPAMEILSFLTQIGDALNKQSASDMGPSWEITRIVNYHQGLGRMNLVPPVGADETQARGTILVQTFELADGSLCLKANLSWQGCEEVSTFTVYSKPGLNWRAAYAQIASTWLAGPPAVGATVALGETRREGEEIDLQRILAEAQG
jgi:hypothetical protein